MEVPGGTSRDRLEPLGRLFPIQFTKCEEHLYRYTFWQNSCYNIFTSRALLFLFRIQSPGGFSNANFFFAIDGIFFDSVF